MTNREQRVDTGRHRGRRVFVTGAASGIGRATALRLALEGAEVFGCDIDETGLAETERLLGTTDRLWRCDITVQSDVDTVAERLAEHGGVDSLANVAGVIDDIAPAGEVDDAVWHRVIDVNVTGAMRMFRAVLPLLVSRGGGAVTNIGSAASLSGGHAGTAYTVSKHAVLGLTRSIAHMYGPSGIRCNAICPGGVRTAMAATVESASALAVDRLKHQWKRGSSVEPDEIAALVSWLASDEASNLNGAVITSDAGLTAC